MTSTTDSEVVKDLKPASKIELVFRNGSSIRTDCILLPEDFMRIWNKPFTRYIKICSGGNSYVFARKKYVVSLKVVPVM